MSSTPEILCDGRWVGPHGIGRFARNVLERLPDHVQLRSGPKPLSPLDPLWLSYQIATRRPSVFFSPGFNPPAVCTRPLVLTIHDLAHLQFPAYATWRRRLYYRLLVKRALVRALRVLTVSEYSRVEILKWSGLPDTHVINVGNGVDPVFRPDGPRYEPGYPYLLYAGNARAHKNLGRLFEAFPRISFPELRLILTGRQTVKIREQLEQLKLCGRVQFAGDLSDEILASVYRGAACLVYPSLLEGFGLPPLEAMASGTPVVVSHTSALPEVVGDAALLIDPLDTDDLRRAIERVLGDAGLRYRMREAGLSRARLFCWDCVAAKVRRVIAEGGNFSAILPH
jgi:glycosyltransferase involved in cell wall biosynthesis